MEAKEGKQEVKYEELYHSEPSQEEDVQALASGLFNDSLVQYGPIEVVEGVKETTASKALKSESQKKSAVTDVLQAILPPREARLPDGRRAVQPVLAAKAERDDVIKLQMELEKRLQERQARETGLCPVREQLYSQCFDELIRQVTIERPERGLLLVRVRDEIKMTINAYQTLYKSSITFGLRKTLQAEQGNTEVTKKVEELQLQKKKLQAQLAEQRALCDSLEKRTTEKRIATEKKMMEEKEFLKFQTQHLETFLKSVNSQQ